MEGAGKGGQQKEKNFVGKEGRIVVGNERVLDMTNDQGANPNGWIYLNFLFATFKFWHSAQLLFVRYVLRMAIFLPFSFQEFR